MKRFLVAVALAIGFFGSISNTLAQGKSCVYNCDPPSPGAGWYGSPAPVETPQSRAFDLNSRGNAAFERGDYQEAARLYRQALQLTPNDAQLAKNLRWTLGMQRYRDSTEFLNSNQRGNAIEALKEACAYYPEHSNICRYLNEIEAYDINKYGLDMERAGNIDAARQAYDRAWARRPGDPIIRENRIRIYNRLQSADIYQLDAEGCRNMFENEMIACNSIPQGTWEYRRCYQPKWEAYQDCMRGSGNR